MEEIMSQSVMEIDPREAAVIDGGWDWDAFACGVGLIGTPVAFVFGTPISGTAAALGTLVACGKAFYGES